MNLYLEVSHERNMETGKALAWCLAESTSQHNLWFISARKDYGLKELVIHYGGHWPPDQPLGGLHFFDYMNGRECHYKKFDGDCLSMIDLIAGMGDKLNGFGRRDYFQYLDGGFLLDIYDEQDLLRFWIDSDQK
ncbi:uncharacterized protein LOC113310688 [Papaver somniferum]|uniref:uncharacterized protein LOC113310688 n=1 Tax=Papaver somniferum TaxID=3469 RepID=UPI000E6F8AE8|nr:uncharacterized protein LOC113310688 [Papaver somniferum]